MCGRFVRSKEIDAIVRDFSVRAVACDLSPSYNVAPTQQVAVIIEDGVKQLVSVRWGLVPSWASDLSVGNRLINARAETVTQRDSFRDAFERRGCLVVADGFYEWRRAAKRRQPIFIRLKCDRAFGFAGSLAAVTQRLLQDPFFHGCSPALHSINSDGEILLQSSFPASRK